VYVSSQVFVRGRESESGGEFSLAKGFGEGSRGERRMDGAGETLVEVDPEVIVVLGSGENGLPDVDGDRS
jgi:hypothetical protein